MKTSQNLSSAFDTAIKQQNVSTKLMAEDTGQTLQALSNYRHGHDMPADKAVKNADYLGDAKFNTQAAAKFYKTLSMWSTHKWNGKFANAPFATWFEQLQKEDQRRETGNQVHNIMVKKQSQWTDEEHDIVHNWLIMLLEGLMLGYTDAYQTCEVAGEDLMDLIDEVNRDNGDFE